jgi:nicotinamidase-related amidase
MNLHSSALLIVDLQNDFLHPDGAYARGARGMRRLPRCRRS